MDDFWMTRALIFALFAMLLPSSGCDAPLDDVAPAESDSGLEVRSGAGAAAANQFALLEGQRVGLIVNHTAQVDSVHLIDLMAAAPGVEITALFGPEHGLRGEYAAGEKITDGRDEATGAPVYSLYGDSRAPTSAMLDSVDVLAFDIQDIGARFYTYISTLGLSMQAAAREGIPFVVLDRPNPLGGERVAGFIMEPQYESFVGMYPIPIQHGMTVGELARMIQGEGFLEGLDSLDLRVVEVENWSRGMLWPGTGLPWIAPSPNIPEFDNALVYPGAALFEATSASEGRGTQNPFVLLGAPWVDAEALVDTLNNRDLPGVRFEQARFTPEAIPGMAPYPDLEGQQLQGLRYVVTEPEAFKPVATGIHVLYAFYLQAPEQLEPPFINNPEWLARLSGTDTLYDMLMSGATPREIIDAWDQEVETFRDRREPYLLYQ